MSLKLIKAGACFLVAAGLSYIGILFPISVAREYGWNQLVPSGAYSLISLLLAALLVWLDLRALRKSS